MYTYLIVIDNETPKQIKMEANDNFWWCKITRLIDMSRFKCFMSILISFNFNFSACMELLMCHVFDEYISMLNI